MREYAKERDRVAGILYVRNRLAGELAGLRADVARLHEAACEALRTGQEELARARLRDKDARLVDVARIEVDLGRVRVDAEEAKAGLVALLERLRKAEREKLLDRATELAAVGTADRFLVDAKR